MAALATCLSLVTAAGAQMTAPRIGYVYPAGGQRGTEFEIAVGGRFLRGVEGVDISGKVTGVRILQHRETPGLGDKIESARSDWVFQFDGRAIGNPVLTAWAIKDDGGDFDQLTGASVTPRAVINAVRDTLVYFDANRDEIFALPATEESE